MLPWWAVFIPVVAVLVTGAINAVLHWRLGVRQAREADKDRSDRAKQSAVAWRRDHVMKASAAFLSEAHKLRHAIRTMEKAHGEGFGNIIVLPEARPDLTPAYVALAEVRLCLPDEVADLAVKLFNELRRQSVSEKASSQEEKDATVALFKSLIDKSKQSVGFA